MLSDRHWLRAVCGRSVCWVQSIVGLVFQDIVNILRSVRESCVITFGRGLATVRALGVLSCKAREVHPDRYTAIAPKFLGVRKADQSIPGVVRGKPLRLSWVCLVSVSDVRHGLGWAVTLWVVHLPWMCVCVPVTATGFTAAGAPEVRSGAEPQRASRLRRPV